MCVDTKPALADVMRELADVIETNSIELEYVSFFRGAVIISDEDFIRLFAGLETTGVRDNGSCYVKVRAEKFGFVWESRVYRPLEKAGTETVKL